MFASRRGMEYAALMGLSLVLFLRYPVHFALSSPFLMDFTVYHTIAQRVLQGAAAQLYAPTSSEMMVFKYAPIWALLWAPIGWLSAHAGAVLWTSGSVLALVATLALCARFCRAYGLDPHPLTGVAALVMLVRPLAEEMGNGQVNLLWGCLIAASLYAAARHRPWLSAWALAGAILLKLPAAIFLPYFVARRQWAMLGRAVAAAAAATLISSAILIPAAPLTLVLQWGHALARNGTQYAFEIGNQSVLALLARLFTHDGYGLNLLTLSRMTITWMAGAGLLLSVIAIGWPNKGRGATARELYDGAQLSVVMVIFSPSCWLATYTALLLPIFALLAVLTHRLRQRRLDWPALCLGSLAIGLSYLTHRAPWRWIGLRHWRGESYLFLVFMVLPWMGLALLGSLWRLRATDDISRS